MVPTSLSSSFSNYFGIESLWYSNIYTKWRPAQCISLSTNLPKIRFSVAVVLLYFRNDVIVIKQFEAFDMGKRISFLNRMGMWHRNKCWYTHSHHQNKTFLKNYKSCYGIILPSLLWSTKKCRWSVLPSPQFRYISHHDGTQFRYLLWNKNLSNAE